MRILTVRAPWAWAIIHGGKDVENRGRNIAGDWRGPVAIHVAQRLVQWADASRTGGGEALAAATAAAYSRMGSSDGAVAPWYSNLGAIIGVVDLVDVHYCDVCIQLPVSHGVPRARMCSPWSETRAHHLVLANPRPLARPLPFKGALGLRTLQPATVAAVLRRLEVA